MLASTELKTVRLVAYLRRRLVAGSEDQPTFVAISRERIFDVRVEVNRHCSSDSLVLHSNRFRTDAERINDAQLPHAHQTMVTGKS